MRHALRRTVAVALGAAVIAALAAGPAGAARSSSQRSHPVFAPVHVTGPHSAARAPAKLTYHGGKIVKASTSYAIFWKPAKLQSGPSTSMSPTYQSLITRYFGDIGGSGLMNSATQYYQIVNSTKTFITNSSHFTASWTDTSAYPASGCTDAATPGNCLTDTQVRAEIKKALTTNGWTPGPGKIFFLYTSKGEGSCVGTDCAFQIYCAYHWNFALNGKQVIYGNMPYAATALNGCGAPKSPNNDIDADSAINLTSHEQMEAITDPLGNAWFDAQGAENGDKCAWNFGSTTLDGGKANESWNGHFYLVQQEWSNAGAHCVQTYP
jgi:hypothetical protein